jgi:hypothetical protein
MFKNKTLQVNICYRNLTTCFDFFQILTNSRKNLENLHFFTSIYNPSIWTLKSQIMWIGWNQIFQVEKLQIYPRKKLLLYGP